MFRLLLLSLLVFAPLSARADWPPPSATEMAAMEKLEPQQRWDSAQWQKDRNNITGNKMSCQESWDILWAWAKKGNLQARSLLLASEASPGFHFETTPITPDDPSQRVWASLFLAIYQLGYEDGTNGLEDYARMSLDYIETWKAKGVQRFAACYHKNPSPLCTAIAIEEGLIPTFDVFAAQIDARVKAGVTPVCRAGG